MVEQKRNKEEDKIYISFHTLLKDGSDDSLCSLLEVTSGILPRKYAPF